MPYASRTGTRTTLAALRAAGWRLLISAAGVWRDEGMPYAIDNGAWSAHQSRRPFDSAAFVGLVEAKGAGADFVVVPDVVGDGAASLAMSIAWLPWLRWRLPWPGPRLLIPVQNGMGCEDVAHLLDERHGVFVGGDTDWKLRTMRTWGGLTRSLGAHLHVGRVNTQRRVRLCQDAGADSFDGSGVVRFPSTLARVDAAVRQAALEM